MRATQWFASARDAQRGLAHGCSAVAQRLPMLGYVYGGVLLRVCPSLDLCERFGTYKEEKSLSNCEEEIGCSTGLLTNKIRCTPCKAECLKYKIILPLITLLF